MVAQLDSDIVIATDHLDTETSAEERKAIEDDQKGEAESQEDQSKTEESKEGKAEGPYNMRKGMNVFLERVGVTFRRDKNTHRPRINKPESRLDREQKSKKEYYYSS